METRNVTITLEKAKEWFNSHDNSLKEIALQAFTERELTTKPFKEITTFNKAVEALNLNLWEITHIYNNIKKISKASAAMFKLNLVRKALNLGYELELTKDPKDSHIWYPYTSFITKDSTYYSRELNLGEIEVIGHIRNKGITYKVMGGTANYGGFEGLSCFNFYNSASNTHAGVAFLGCANKEIAKHFSKYFGMLIIEAEFGDIKDFKVVE